MEPTHDSRRPEAAAGDKTAGYGGGTTKEPVQSGGPQSGTPRSWRQYIEQTLPEQETGPKAGQESISAQQRADQRREQIRAARERCARWARERGRRLLAAVSACVEKVSTAAGAAGKKLAPAAAVCREKADSVAAVFREKLGPGAERFRAAVARHPISPLLYVTLLAVLIGTVAFQGNYARAYVLEVNDHELGLVSSADEANALLSSAEHRAASIWGDGFDCDVVVSLSPVYAALGDLTDAAEMEEALFEVMGGNVPTSAYTAPVNKVTTLTAWAISVDGVEMGVAATENEFYQMLDELAQPYLPENSVRYEFVEDVQVYSVELPLNTVFDDLESLREELSALRVEEAVYVVQKGDTFNAIAYSLDMKPYQLSALNPDVNVNRLSIGQKLVIQRAVPRLSVLATTDETYEAPITSPVEYIETADLYKGDTKVKTQGKDGLALVNAQVTYLNNVEQEREILESTTLKEATTTYIYKGTTPKPATASKGYYTWPVKGTVTSKFGYRYIFGKTAFHSGLDIGVPVGTTIKAADGGTVVKAAWDNSYGYYVLIRHDNGTETLYAHNSSLLVKTGAKVYQGQAIAKSGATGNVTGPHCHFEIRINGTRVDPLKYLK